MGGCEGCRWGLEKGCLTGSPDPQPPCRTPVLPRAGEPFCSLQLPRPRSPQRPSTSLSRTPSVVRPVWGQGSAGGTGQHGWEAVLALLLWQAGAARPSPHSDHSLEECRLLLAGLRGQQLGFCLGCQVLQVMVAPDWSGQELPALWGPYCQHPGVAALGTAWIWPGACPLCTGMGLRWG